MQLLGRHLQHLHPLGKLPPPKIPQQFLAGVQNQMHQTLRRGLVQIRDALAIKGYVNNRAIPLGLGQLQQRQSRLVNNAQVFDHQPPHLQAFQILFEAIALHHQRINGHPGVVPQVGAGRTL